MQGRGSDYFLKSLSSNFDCFPLIALHASGGFAIDNYNRNRLLFLQI